MMAFWTVAELSKIQFGILNYFRRYMNEINSIYDIATHDFRLAAESTGRITPDEGKEISSEISVA